MISSASRDEARALDAEDPLRRFRDEFHFPHRPEGTPEVYLTGHSLGLQPKRTASFLEKELHAWRNLAVRGHFEGDHPWMPYHSFLTAGMASIAGALPHEVVVMSSLTANLHLLMVSFYRPTAKRFRILIEGGAFPSDRYAVESQIRFHGFDPADALIVITPREGEETIRDEDLYDRIGEAGESLALVLLPGVQYYTGQALDIAQITKRAHESGALAGFDLAHAAGNLELHLHQDGPDFAVWCTYKYLNSGPGSVGAAFVHERHAERFDLPRFAGWWGHDQETRFRMGPDFRPMRGAEGWQLSNPPILSLAAIRASLEVFDEAGGMAPLRRKSERLTAFFASLLIEKLGDHVTLVTPEEPHRRGAQLSFRFRSSVARPREVFRRLEASGVTCDWREPNVVRAAAVPLYNTFEDVYRCVERLEQILKED